MRIGIFILIAILLVGCIDEPEINLLCKKENKEGKFEEVYLVKNYPKKENDLYKLIDSFNQDLKAIENTGKRTFIKEHDNRATDFALGDYLDYEKSKCKEIDNMDILCEVSKVNFYNGGDTIVFNYFK